jgi:hypothetical protein
MRLTLGEIIMFLRGCGLIDQDTYSRMFEVKNKRDDLVHTEESLVIHPEPIMDEKAKEAERLIRKAMQSIKVLVGP